MSQEQMDRKHNQLATLQMETSHCSNSAEDVNGTGHSRRENAWAGQQDWGIHPGSGAQREKEKKMEKRRELEDIWETESQL